MKLKKIITSFLTIAFCTVFLMPIGGNANANTNTNTNDETLYDFIKNTKEIKGNYIYPSMKIASSSGKSLISAHTPIMIRSNETITTKDIVSGSEVVFSVVNDIKDSYGNILIKANTPVTAQISFARSKGLVGRSGEITITDFHTTATDGTYVPLSASVSAKPDDEMVLSIVLSVLICPLFLLMKGDEAQVAAGTTKTAYTVTDVYVKPVRL